MARHFSLQDVADLNFFTLTGDVLRATSRSETVTQWRPSGHMAPNSQGTGRHYKPGTSQVSTTRQRNQFAIRDERGAVTDVEAIGADVCEGQRVSIVYAAEGNAAWGRAVGIYNHNSGRKTYLEEGIQAFRGESPAQLGCFGLLGVALLTIVTLGLALVVLVVWMLANSRSYTRVDAAIKARVDEQISQVTALR